MVTDWAEGSILATWPEHTDLEDTDSEVTEFSAEDRFPHRASGSAQLLGAAEENTQSEDTDLVTGQIL